MRIAITGASGNLGTALIRALRASDPAAEIVGICRRPPAQHTGGIEWRPMDLTAVGVEPVLSRALEGGKIQFVHADDVGDAFVRILDQRAPGAFNLAADVLGPAELAGLFGARPVEVPVRAVRGFVNVAFHAHAIRTTPGWFDLLMQGPLLDASRARTELGWEPRRSSTQAVDDLLDGFAENVHGPTPALLGS